MFVAGQERAVRMDRAVDRVRRTRDGEDRAAVAARLRTEYAAQGVPQPPELVEAMAEVVVSGRLAAARTGLGRLRQWLGGETLVGVRHEHAKLDGSRWVSVETRTDAETQHWLGIARKIETTIASMHRVAEERFDLRVRLVPVPVGRVERIGVFVPGNLYAGPLPGPADEGLLAAFAEADAADKRLMVRCRVDGEPSALILSVALP